MKYKTTDLTGALLDAAVAKANGLVYEIHLEKVWGDGYGITIVNPNPACWTGAGYYEPSTDWSQGGLIIARERIDVAAPDEYSDDERWFAGIYHGSARHATPRCCEMRGDTPLIAAMRAFVALKLGDEVNL